MPVSRFVTAWFLGAALTPMAAHSARAGRWRSDLRNVVFADKANARLDPEGRRTLIRDGAVVCQGDEGHFFGLYDRNRYAGIPNLVTVDAVLHVVHVRLDAAIAGAEARVAQPLLKGFAVRQRDRAATNMAAQPSEANRWRPLLAYHAVAAALLSDGCSPPASAAEQWQQLDAPLAEVVRREVGRVCSAKGIARSEVCPGTLDYSLFAARGHYDNATLAAYFRAVTFYSQCGFSLGDPIQALQAIDLVRMIDAEDRQRLARLQAFFSAVAGPADDPGVDELTGILPEASPASPSPLPPSLRDKVLQRARALRPGVIPADAGPPGSLAAEFRLLGGSATLDSQFFLAATGAGTNRTVPSALDLLAGIGSSEARAVLADLTRPGPSRSAGPERSTIVGSSIFTRWLRVLQTLVRPGPTGAPDFASTPTWARHELVAAAGSWAQLRHDTLLFVKQPLVWAQGGHDQELPATKAGGYVEPRPDVYRALDELLVATAADLNLNDEELSVSDLRDLLAFLVRTAELQLSGAAIPKATDARLRDIGTELERLSLGHGDAPPRQAVVADVFTVIDESGGAGRPLEVGVGNVDEVWAIVPRRGEWALMRGGAFSYYEFLGEPGQRLTDDAWLERLDNGRNPTDRPTWASPTCRGRREGRRQTIKRD